MTVGIVVATFGDLDVWAPLARRAIASADAQTVPTPVTWVHGESLAAARNEGVEIIGTDWVIICDADDELDSGYVESMLTAVGDIRRPSTYGIYPDGTEEDCPSMIPVRDIRVSNYIVIGAMFRREMFLEVGGFDSSLSALEDWDLWLKMVLKGAEVVDVPSAIYRIHVSEGSRNMSTSDHSAAYQVIRARYRS